MTTLNTIVRRISTTAVLGALALTLATYGTFSTLADAGNSAASQDRLVKVGGLEKVSALVKDDQLVAKDNDDSRLGKSDEYAKDDGLFAKVEDDDRLGKSDDYGVGQL